MKTTFKYEGTVIAGTLRDEDLIPAFLDALDTIDPEQTKFKAHRSAIRRDVERTGYYEEDAGDLAAAHLDELFGFLNDFAPEGYYFGAHPGDGSDFGFWENEEEEDDKPKVVSVYSGTLLKFIARTLFVCAWADEEENDGRSYPGQELFDVAPETPVTALVLAGVLLGRIEEQNHAPYYILIKRAADADAVTPEEIDEEQFGYSLAMMALGHGVSWFDDHAKFDLKVPNIEVLPEDVGL